MYESERDEGEPFNDYAERAERRFEDEVRDLAMPIEFSLENMSHFMDRSARSLQVIRGEGECV